MALQVVGKRWPDLPWRTPWCLLGLLGEGVVIVRWIVGLFFVEKVGVMKAWRAGG